MGGSVGCLIVGTIRKEKEMGNRVETLDFPTVFDGITAEHGIPKIDELSSLHLREGDYDVMSYVSEEQKGLIEATFESIGLICNSLGVEPLIIDVSLIRDDRASKREAPENFYVSVVKINTGNAEELWDSYLKAIRSPAPDSFDYQSIITHRDFYTPENAVFFANPETTTLKLPRNGDVDPTIKGYRFFPNRREAEESSQPIKGNIKRFLDNFERELKEKVPNGLAATRIAVIAIPIVRAYYVSRVEHGSGSHTLGTPGGTLFIFAKVHSKARDTIQNLTKGITNLILRGSLSLSISQVERKEIVEKSFSGAYSFAHPLKGRLGALSNVIEQVSELVPEEYRLQREHLLATSRSTHLFAEQANLIHFAAIRGAAELRNPDEEYSQRYMRDTCLDLKETIFDKTEEIFGPILSEKVDLRGEGRPRIDPYHLEGHPELEPMRVMDDLYIQLFFEMINNAILHGGPKEGPIVVNWSVEDDVCFGGTKKRALILSNKWLVKPRGAWLAEGKGEWMPVESSSPTGLQFVSNTLSHTGGGSVASRADLESEEFGVALFLNGLASD